jgi:ATP/maltotriose-dependent transcriptional regulator MalT
MDVHRTDPPATVRSSACGQVALTHRQREVLALIAEGCANEEVGERLGISTRTARAHADVLRSKLAVVHRRQIPYAYRTLTGEDPLFAAE